MNQINVNSSLFKTIGFMDYDNVFYDELRNNDFFQKTFDKETLKFLENSYHSEYAKIMFSNDNSGVKIFSKKLDYKISIKNNSIVQEELDLEFVDPETEDMYTFSEIEDLFERDVEEYGNDLKTLINIGEIKSGILKFIKEQ